MGFKHTGLFPEQAVNWDWFSEKIRAAGPSGARAEPVCLYRRRNACLRAPAGARGLPMWMPPRAWSPWARENVGAVRSLAERPNPVVWWTTVTQFVQVGAQRRGIHLRCHYHGSAFLRAGGRAGEVWKLEDCKSTIWSSIAARCCCPKRPLFFLLNSYTTGLSPSAMGYILEACKRRKKATAASITADEIGLPVAQTGGVLPCGAIG